MDEEKKKRKKKPVDAGDGGHKKPWQETYATPTKSSSIANSRTSEPAAVGKCGSGDVFLNPSRTACVYAVRETS